MNIDRLDVAEVTKVTSHDFRRKRDQLAPFKNTEEKPDQSTYDQEQFGWEESRSEGERQLSTGLLAGSIF